MCWSFGASTILAIVGVAVAIYLASKKRSKLLWIPLIYFSLMELLQSITYLSLNECALPINQMLTLLGYMHISFQPFFFNMIGLYFIPEKARNKIQGFVYALCFVAVIFFAAGCTEQLGETKKEGSIRHTRNARINRSELMEDLDKIFHFDKPSKLSDRRVP